LATLLGAVGVWLMLPRGAVGGRMAGVVLTAVALGLGASRFRPLGDWTADGLFFVLAGVTVVAALATVTFRNPVYCAVWFGMTLAGTAGLFLFTGAQFLAVATLVVYAGAILVTFLFVLMLAQPEGDAPYDRRSWEALLSATTGAVLVGILTMTLTEALAAGPKADRPETARAATMTTPATAAELSRGVLAPQHVARVGGELFGRHLIAVEVAGTLLLAAVVGAAVIVAQGRACVSEGDGPIVAATTRSVVPESGQSPGNSLPDP
jgi:NADH-quinone oxidoreductase subunit J